MRAAVNWRVGVWGLPLTGVAALVWATLHSEGAAVRAPRVEREITVRAAAPYPGESLSSVFIGRDPFRVARRPAPTAYDPIGPAPAEAPALPKPLLALTGIVWGEVPEAVLEGLPGTDGPRVVRQGEVIGALRVRTIGRNRLVITGLDTVWTLTVREPWK